MSNSPAAAGAQAAPSLRRRAAAGAVHIHDLCQSEWSKTGKAGMVEKVVRRNDEAGQWLGLVAFEAGTRSGLHQHLGPAVSVVLDGSLHDYQGSVEKGYAGINLAGATHDAMAYEPTLLVSKLQGPVLLPEEARGAYTTHVGARFAELSNPAPENLPDLNICIAAQPMIATGVARVSRRLVFDYRGADENHRFCELALMPGAALPAHRAHARVDLFVLGGQLQINGQKALANSFVLIEPDTQVEIDSVFGARFLVWSEAPVTWLDGQRLPDPYGF